MEAPCLLLPRETGKAGVTCLSSTQVMFRDDVIDLEGKVEILRGDLAVFTAATRPLSDEVFERTFHACSVHLGRTVALAAFE